MRELGLSFVQLLLGLFGRGDIHQRPSEFQLTSMIPDGMGDNMNVFDRSIRHQQPIFIIEILALAGCALDRASHESAILRMNALQDHVEGDGGRFLVSKYSEAFL